MDIAIHDRVNLVGLFEAIGPLAHTASWRVRGPVQYGADVDIAALDVEKHDTGPWMTGPVFRSQMDHVRLVIDGVFEASPSSAGEPRSIWVTLRAVDSSWWEMYSSDIDLIARIQERFSDVHPARYRANTV